MDVARRKRPGRERGRPEGKCPYPAPRGWSAGADTDPVPGVEAKSMDSYILAPGRTTHYRPVPEKALGLHAKSIYEHEQFTSSATETRRDQQ